MLLAVVLLTIINTTDGYKAANPIIREAVDWQSKTKGTVAISMKLSTPFKLLAGTKYIDEDSLNTIVFGSSTVMGVRSKMFPEPFRMYNYATNANPLAKSIGEINYFIETNKNIKWVVVGVDYSIAYAFRKTPIEEYRPDVKAEEISMLDMLKDAITLDRLKISMLNLWQNMVADDDVYNCPENDGVGWDFGTTRTPGQCDGFRHDGSATFHYKRMNSTEWKNDLSANGLKRYITSLNRSSGKINKNYLTELEKIGELLKMRSGRLIVLLPSLMPGAEKFILKSPTGVHLQRYKADVSEWAQKNGIYLIDAGPSENFGCTYAEFYDSHHALDHCYCRVFEGFSVSSLQ
jgi:hypothetical protein